MAYTIVYMGTPHYAEAILQTLIEAEDMNVRLVLTQPDRPAGRKNIMTPPPVKVLAEKYGISVLQPNRLRDEGVVEAIMAQKPDFIVVAAFGQLLPKTVLDIAPCINLHASLLPQYRGASPIQQSLLFGDMTTGVTSMLMEEGLDTGPILEKVEFIIPLEIRFEALMQQLTYDASMLTLFTLRNFESITPQPQNNTKATHCKKIKKSDGEVDFVDVQEVYNKYRAFEGWPGIFAFNGVKFEGLTLVEDRSSNQPFELLDIEGDSVIIGCAKGSLKIDTIQPPSKKAISSKVYCISRGIKVGHSIF